MSFDLSCRKCGSRLVIKKTTTSSYGLIKVWAQCPNWKWYSMGHEKGVSFSRDAKIWTEEAPSLVIKGDKATYTHRGPALTLCEGDTLTVDYKVHLQEG